MKSHARAIQDEAILIDHSARLFGGFHEAFRFRLRPRSRDRGVLILTEHTLTFEQPSSGTRIEIPVAAIQRLGLGPRRGPGAEPIQVLRITYGGNLVLGIQVSDPRRWIEILPAVAAGQGAEAVVDSVSPRLAGFRHHRLAVVCFLILVLVLSIGLPLLSLWKPGTATPERPAPAPPQSSRTGTSP